MRFALAISLALVGLAVISVFIFIPFFSKWAFWVVVAAFLILIAGGTWGFAAVISLVLMMVAIVSVFVFVPFFSEWAFWVGMAAYVMMGVSKVP
jgi:hypothetical protein